MKEKCKKLYQLLKPHLALFLAVVLVFGVIPTGSLSKVKAADVTGGRSQHPAAEGLQYASEVGIKEYSLNGETVTISTGYGKDGKQENPYVIRTPEELVYFGQMKPEHTQECYFLLTETTYNMSGDQYYMHPLFPTMDKFAGDTSDMVSAGFAGNLIGNTSSKGITITNAYIVDQGTNEQRYEQALFGVAGTSNYYKKVNILGISLENSVFVSDRIGDTVTFVGSDVSKYGSTLVISSSGIRNSNAKIQLDNYTLTFPSNWEQTAGSGDILGSITAKEDGTLHMNKVDVSLKAGTTVTFYQDGGFRFSANDIKVGAWRTKADTTYYSVNVDMSDGLVYCMPLSKEKTVTEQFEAYTDDLEISRLIFLGWNTSAAAVTGDMNYKISGSGTIYAVWGEEKPPMNFSDSATMINITDETFIYNGEKQIPEVYNVIYGEKYVLFEGDHYTVSYTKDAAGTVEINEADIVNAGEYYVKVEAIDGSGYTGTATKAFRIDPKMISLTVNAGLGKVSGESDPQIIYTAEGLVQGDTLKGAPTREAGEAPGLYGYVLGDMNAKNPNYAMTLNASDGFVISPDLSMLNDLTVQNIKMSDQAKVTELKAVLEKIDPNLRKKYGWEETYQNCAALLAVISSCAAAASTDAVTRTEAVNSGNVKIENKADLEQAKKDLVTALETYGGNLTDAEKANLQAEIARIDGALAVLTKAEQIISGTVADVVSSTAGITAANVKTEQKTVLEQAKNTIKIALDANANYLTETEKASLQAEITRIDGVLAVISSCAAATSTAAVTRTETVNSGNVKIENKADLQQAKKDLVTALETYGGNLTDAEKVNLQAEIARIDGVLTVITNVEQVSTLVAALPETVEVSDIEAVKKVDAANAAYTALTEYAKSLLPAESTEKLTVLLDSIQLQENLPAAGTKFKDASGKATYKVLTAGMTDGTVQYVEPKSKKAKQVVIPDTIKDANGIRYKVTSIAKNAFKNNKYVTSVKIGKNVEKIGSYVFYNNKKLTSVTLGKNVTSIGDKAFYKCEKLTKITIPSKVTKIGKQAFYNCKKLKSITIKTSKLSKKNVGTNAFKNIHAKAVITVPKKKAKTYKSMLKARGVSARVTIKIAK